MKTTKSMQRYAVREHYARMEAERKLDRRQAKAAKQARFDAIAQERVQKLLEA